MVISICKPEIYERSQLSPHISAPSTLVLHSMCPSSPTSKLLPRALAKSCRIEWGSFPLLPSPTSRLSSSQKRSKRVHQSEETALPDVGGHNKQGLETGKSKMEVREINPETGKVLSSVRAVGHKKVKRVFSLSIVLLFIRKIYYFYFLCVLPACMWTHPCHTMLAEAWDGC